MYVVCKKIKKVTLFTSFISFSTASFIPSPNLGGRNSKSKGQTPSDVAGVDAVEIIDDNDDNADADVDIDVFFYLFPRKKGDKPHILIIILNTQVIGPKILSGYFVLTARDPFKKKMRIFWVGTHRLRLSNHHTHSLSSVLSFFASCNSRTFSRCAY